MRDIGKIVKGLVVVFIKEIGIWFFVKYYLENMLWVFKGWDLKEIR